MPRSVYSGGVWRCHKTGIDMKIDTIKNQQFCALFAPDGTWQPMFTSEDMIQSIGLIQMLASTGISKDYCQMQKEGCQFRTVSISIKVIASEDEAFEAAQIKHGGA